MRIKLVLFFCFISITAFAQNGITFEVEELSKPGNLAFDKVMR